MSTLSAPFGREAQVLLLGARPRLSEDAERRLRAHLQGPLDWERVLALARQHRVTPLLHRRLSADPLAAEVPADVLDALQERFRQSAVRGLSQERALVQVLALLQDNGVPALPFKGAVLGERVYGNVALRPFGDLDILVPEDDVSLARSLLRANDFRSLNVMSEEEEASHFRRGKSYEMRRGDVYVELHWAFLHPMHGFDLDWSDVWDRTRQVPLGDTHVPALPPDDLLIYLCAHGGKHFWGRLSWICDVAECLHTYRDELHWPSVFERARTLHAERLLLLGLQLAADLLGAAGPGSLAQAADDDAAVGELSTRVQRRLLRERTDDGLTMDDALFHLKMRERLRDRLPYCRQLARLAVEPTAKDRAWVELRPSLHFAYYALRPVRLLCNGVDRLLERSAPRS
jgi:hypothetical protein